MLEIFGPIFEQNVTINFESIFEQNAYFGPIFEKCVNFEHFVNGKWSHYKSKMTSRPPTTLSTSLVSADAPSPLAASVPVLENIQPNQTFPRTQQGKQETWEETCQDMGSDHFFLWSYIFTRPMGMEIFSYDIFSLNLSRFWQQSLATGSVWALNPIRNSPQTQLRISDL